MTDRQLRRSYKYRYLREPGDRIVPLSKLGRFSWPPPRNEEAERVYYSKLVEGLKENRRRHA